MADIGRNEPCLCGSGKKFKKCCAGASATEPELTPEARRAQDLHRLDQDLVDEMLRFAKKRLGDRWFQAIADEYFDEFEETPYEVQLLIPWSVYHYETDGSTLARLYAVERGHKLSEAQRQWLAAQDRAWLSLWEIHRVEPGVGVAVKDLLTREERFVHEVKGSKTLRTRDCMLGRVIDLDGISVFCGMHPRTLPPMASDGVLQLIRRVCRVRTKAVPSEKLRDLDVQVELIDLWHVAVEEGDRPKPLPQLANTDGDPILLTTDHFDFDPKDRALIVDRLQAAEGAQEAVDEDGEAEVSFTKPGNAKIKAWDNTILGRALVGKERVKIETNSIKRADLLRKRAEAALGDLIRHRLRDHSDLEPRLADAAKRPSRPPPEQPPELKAVLREMREKYMASWLDDEIPALGGLTPREAMKKPGTRKELDLLLRDMENRDARMPEEDRFDYGRLRRELGLGN